MRRLALALVLLPPLAACGQPAEIDVEDAWARDTVGSTANAAVFMTITSEMPDRLIDASTSVANKTDLMTMEVTENTMAMSYVVDIDIPAGEPVILDPSGLHVWLADLKEPLKSGTSFMLSLEFEKAGRQEVRVAVMAPSAAPPMSGMEM